MQNLNQVTLVGRVGSDPESQQVNQSTLCRISVATNRVWKDAQGEKKEATTWHRVVAWGKTAETVQSYCKKGMLVFVTGSVENREYDKDGERRTISEIKAQQVGFLSGTDNGLGNGRQGGAVGGGYAPQQNRRAGPPHQGYGNAPQQQRGGWGHQQAELADDVPF